MMEPKIVPFDVALKSTERQQVQKIPEVYTNDLHSVSLQFRITDCTDTELTGSTAIVLLKMRDGSFFQPPSVDVTRALNVFSYTLKENEGNHDGLAETQLVVTIGAKEFATQKYNFKVISGLDSEVAREIMIYDWSTLTAEARAYIDQFTADEVLRDAEFDNNQFDRNVAFNAAQGQRATDFGLAQTQRNTDFGLAQTQRVNTFNSAEAARVQAFNNAETARAAGYDADHSRAETDHTNAADDRTLAGTDHTRAEADHTRANTDSATVAGFNARMVAEETATENNKISAVKGKTFADVDARLEDIEIAIDARTEFEARNLVVNGDFSTNDTSSWKFGWGIETKTVSGGVLTINYPSYGEWHSRVVTFAGQAIKVTPNNKFYMAMQVSGIGAVLSYGGVNRTSATVDGNWTKLSCVFTPAETAYMADSFEFGMEGLLNTTYQIKQFTVIDLTATFGAGKEPTLAEMDRLMARFPNSWFDGVKPIQTIETLYQEKANKVQEDWITPTLLNGWITGDSSYFAPIQYKKDNFGFVHLRGGISNGVAMDICVLPVMYRPKGYVPIIAKKQWGHATIDWLHLAENGTLSISNGSMPGDTRIYFYAIFLAEK